MQIHKSQTINYVAMETVMKIWMGYTLKTKFKMSWMRTVTLLIIVLSHVCCFYPALASPSCRATMEQEVSGVAACPVSYQKVNTGFLLPRQRLTWFIYFFICSPVEFSCTNKQTKTKSHQPASALLKRTDTFQIYILSFIDHWSCISYIQIPVCWLRCDFLKRSFSGRLRS